MFSCSLHRPFLSGPWLWLSCHCCCSCPWVAQTQNFFHVLDPQIQGKPKTFTVGQYAHTFFYVLCEASAFWWVVCLEETGWSTASLSCHATFVHWAKRVEKSKGFSSCQQYYFSICSVASKIFNTLGIMDFKRGWGEGEKRWVDQDPVVFLCLFFIWLEWFFHRMKLEPRCISDGVSSKAFRKLCLLKYAKFFNYFLFFK